MDYWETSDFVWQLLRSLFYLALATLAGAGILGFGYSFWTLCSLVLLLAAAIMVLDNRAGSLARWEHWPLVGYCLGVLLWAGVVIAGGFLLVQNTFMLDLEQPYHPASWLGLLAFGNTIALGLFFFIRVSVLDENADQRSAEAERRMKKVEQQSAELQRTNQQLESSFAYQKQLFASTEQHSHANAVKAGQVRAVEAQAEHDRRTLEQERKQMQTQSAEVQQAADQRVAESERLAQAERERAEAAMRQLRQEREQSRRERVTANSEVWQTVRQMQGQLDDLLGGEPIVAAAAQAADRLLAHGPLSGPATGEVVGEWRLLAVAAGRRLVQCKAGREAMLNAGYCAVVSCLYEANGEHLSQSEVGKRVNGRQADIKRGTAERYVQRLTTEVGLVSKDERGYYLKLYA